MILHPAIIALILTSGLVTFMVLYAAFFGARIVKHWDISSGSDEQLALERGTYLVSTLLAFAFVLEMVSLFLFIYTAEDLHSRFVGAMCAAGSLNVNAYGYPAFITKIFNCLLAGLWLIMNHADNRAHDYPLIRKKFVLLLIIVPFIVVEAVLQMAYFVTLRPDIITSCCGSLFSTGQDSVSGDLVSLPPGLMMLVFYGSLALLLTWGLIFWASGRGGRIFSFFAVAAFPVFGVSLLSFISLYFYELPTHHCPFCILQREYGYVGYLLYAGLIGGAVSGAGVGLLEPFRSIGSLVSIVPSLTRKLAIASVVCYLVFAVVSIWRMVRTDFTLNIM